MIWKECGNSATLAIQQSYQDGICEVSKKTRSSFLYSVQPLCGREIGSQCNIVSLSEGTSFPVYAHTVSIVDNMKMPAFVTFVFID